MSETFEEVAACNHAKLRCIREETGSELALFLRVMEQAFTVVNTMERPQASPNKSLEIFYYAPVKDEQLAAIKDCICLAWWNNYQQTRDFDRSPDGPRGMMTKEFYALPLGSPAWPTRAQQDVLFDRGLNWLQYRPQFGVSLAGSRIWEKGLIVNPKQFPIPWRQHACMVRLAQEISYADVLEIENPKWLRVTATQQQG